jgi:hypothetical protein
MGFIPASADTMKSEKRQIKKHLEYVGVGDPYSLFTVPDPSFPKKVLAPDQDLEVQNGMFLNKNFKFS